MMLRPWKEPSGENKNAERKLIITDGVFSMDGDIAPLDEITEVAEEYGAMIMVDDCHGEGVLGDGKGIVAHISASKDVLTSKLDLILRPWESKEGYWRVPT